MGKQKVCTQRLFWCIGVLGRLLINLGVPRRGRDDLLLLDLSHLLDLPPHLPHYGLPTGVCTVVKDLAGIIHYGVDYLALQC